jgi:hypothetical protein
MQLNFINSNWHRQYPFKSGHGAVDSQNNILPTDLIVGLRLTCLSSDLEIYIEKIVTSKGKVSISFAGSSGSIGFANALLVSSNQSVPIKNYNNGLIGNVVVGNIDSAMPDQVFVFNETNGLVEPSTVLIVTAPEVSSIRVKNTNLTGQLTLVSNSINILAGNNLSLSVINPSNIESRQDKSARYLTCTNNVISGINSVKPDSQGNIDIYAIAPLVINAVTINDVPQLHLSTPDIELKQLCKVVNLPPANDADVYHQEISDPSLAPEWNQWEQFNT